MSLVVTKATVKVRQDSVVMPADRLGDLCDGWASPPSSSEALKIQLSGHEGQQGMEPFGWLGWKCEPKLIHLFTKLLSEVLSTLSFFTVYDLSFEATTT